MSEQAKSRRSFLGGAALLAASITQLLEAIVRGQIQTAQAKVTGTEESSRSYVQFHPYGAPSRWFFDNVLRPNDSDVFLPCVGVCNRFEEINYDHPHLSTGIYSDVKLQGMNLPHLWSYNVAAPGGKERPMLDLRKHMLTIRGCDAVFNGHPLGSARLVSPLVGGISITGLVADRSRRFLPAISVGKTPANRAFKSPNRASVVEVPSEHPDYVQFLLKAFDLKKPVEEMVDAAESVLKAYSLSNNKGAEILYRDRAEARKILDRGVRDWIDAFPELEKKYSDLIDRSMHLSPIKGVTDKPIPGIQFPVSVKGELDPLKGLASHHHEGWIITGSDFRKGFKGAKTEFLSKHFALAEFVMKQKLSSCLLLASPRERGWTLTHCEAEMVDIKNIEMRYDKEKNQTTYSLREGKTPEGVKRNFAHDSHQTGWISNLVTCNLYYRSLSSCMIELIDQLKSVKEGSETLFEKTVIHLATEFDRYPTSLAACLDHNSNAHVTSIFSGIVKEPMLLGNILVGRKPLWDKPVGTLGDAAVTQGLPNSIINMNNISSTLSELLQVDRVVQRAPSLVKVENGTVKSLVEPARNVEDHA